MIVVDANVVVKWFVTQPGSTDALAIVRSNEELISPDFLMLEVSNAFWRSVRAGLMKTDDASAALSKVPPQFTRFAGTLQLTAAALDIAISIKHSVYDCMYIALAKRERAPLVTADKRLAAVARGLPDVEVRLLGGALAAQLSRRFCLSTMIPCGHGAVFMEGDGIEGLAGFGHEGSACRLSLEQQDKLKAWIAKTLPRSTRQIGEWIEKEFGIA